MAEIAIDLKNINKHFGKFQALNNINLTLYKGEVHCLVGENGCGKSTLIKILSGVYEPDKGALIQIENNPPRDKINPIQAKAAGIHVIWQDLSLFPDLTIAENICFSQFVEKPFLRGNKQEMKNIAITALEKLGINIDVDKPLRELNIANRQLVAIAKTLSSNPKILIMDEPTASLTKNEVDYLLSAVEKLKEQGLAILFVSHRLAEVQSIAQTVTIIRDGNLIQTCSAKGISTAKLSQLMTGYELKDEIRAPAKFDNKILEIKNLSRKNEYQDINLKLHAGEIIGIIGLLGSGRTELALTLFGITKPDAGQIYINNEEVKLKSNRDAIKAGISYVSEDRLNLGLIQAQSIQDNAAITILDKLDNTGFYLKPSNIIENARKWVERFQVKSHNNSLAISSLSGGNQQRIVISKWLATNPKVLILDAPTVGVDIGAKKDIFNIIKELANTGLAIILISDEVSEIYYNCDRAYIMKNKTLSEVIYPVNTTQSEIEELIYV